MPRGKRVSDAWVAEHYPDMTDIHGLLDDHEREFGWRPTAQTIYVRANRLGIHKRPVANRDGRAERPVYWSKEPEKEAWMLEHDHGQRTDDLSDEFRAAWGFGLSRGQINLFRASHGTQAHHEKRNGGRPRVPIGTERVSKDGYVVIKVRHEATVPMSKDNWMLKHVWLYEQAYGELPDGHVVYFADGDRRNFDIDNLVAVPRRLVGVMNAEGAPRWHDRESLLACVALAEVKSRAHHIAMRRERTCAVCGRRFVPDAKSLRCNAPVMTCRACLDAGHKPTHERRNNRKHDHERIRALYDSGLTKAEVARIVGCAPATVIYVINGGRKKVDA